MTFLATNATTRSKLGYAFFVAIFLVPAIAMIIYIVAAIASANIESRTLQTSASLYQNETNGITAQATSPVNGKAWERAAIYICPLH